MIVVHGGAGPVSPDRKAKLQAGVRAAAMAGWNVLERGASALDAVVAAVRILEDDPEFAAGLGASLTRAGTVETCASVMDGRARRAGGVVAAPDLAQPIIVARAMLERGEQAVLSGAGAMQFAAEIGITPAPPGALVTPYQYALLQEVRTGAPRVEGGGVGAVAVDKNGDLAAATSAGGTINRRPGTVDDSAVPGIGTWADAKVAISTCGGDPVFRVALAHAIAGRVADGDDPRGAAKHALQELRKLAKDAVAGVICVDAKSWTALHLGPAMPIAWVDRSGLGDRFDSEL